MRGCSWDNHFHLLLETPQANLVTGMQWLLGTYSQGWNRARLRRGHVFQGRYKSVPVTGTDADAYYFRIVADYIHLNPARAGLAGGQRGPLTGYLWSSLPAYVKGNGPDWLVMERVLRAFELAQDGRGRRAYVAWLEARAGNPNGEIDDEAMAAIRRGWYLGKETFKDRLLSFWTRPTPPPTAAATARVRLCETMAKRKRNGSCAVSLKVAAPRADHGGAGQAAQERPPAKRRSHACCASGPTSATRGSPAGCAMGHPGSVSRMLGACRKPTVKPHPSRTHWRELTHEAERKSEM